MLSKVSGLTERLARISKIATHTIDELPESFEGFLKTFYFRLLGPWYLSVR